MCPKAIAICDGFHNPVGRTRLLAEVGTVGGWLGLALVLTACSPGRPSNAPQEPSASPTAAASPAATLPAATSVQLTPPETRALPGGLTLEAYPLSGPPALEPLTFQPISGTQSEILARHAVARRQVYKQELVADDQYRPTLTAEGQGGQLVARIETDPETQAQTAELRQGDQLIFSAPAGFPSPASALQGLWTYEGHWALELLMATPDLWIGQVYVDGQLLNDEYKYDEAFGFQLIDGRPFYFYLQHGTIGVSFDGQAADLGYTSVPHYECCSGTVLNPVQAHSMVAFFAEQDGEWRYVEIGRFGGT